jgi:hypothetical protein
MHTESISKIMKPEPGLKSLQISAIISVTTVTAWCLLNDQDISNNGFPHADGMGGGKIRAWHLIKKEYIAEYFRVYRKN